MQLADLKTEVDQLKSQQVTALKERTEVKIMIYSCVAHSVLRLLGILFLLILFLINKRGNHQLLLHNQLKLIPFSHSLYTLSDSLTHSLTHSLTCRLRLAKTRWSRSWMTIFSSGRRNWMPRLTSTSLQTLRTNSRPSAQTTITPRRLFPRVRLVALCVHAETAMCRFICVCGHTSMNICKGVLFLHFVAFVFKMLEFFAMFSISME